MRREMFGSLAAMALFAVGLVSAEDSKDKNAKNKKMDKATIATVDAKKGTVAVTTKDEKGNNVQTTLKFADGAQVLDSNGKAAKLDAFAEGDHVRVTEKDGKVSELKKCLARTCATITKMDSKKGAIEVSMKDSDGKEVEKTLHVADGATFFENDGKASKIDAFKTGDHVLITEKDGKISELKKGKEHAQVTITKVDSEKGTITVSMKDSIGKEVEKTFYLTEDAESIDSTGEFAAFDIFQSGDEVILIESEGKIKEVNKDPKQVKAADKKVSAK